jgi:acetyl esterase
MPSGAGVDTLDVELRIDRVRADRSRMDLPPRGAEAPVVLIAAKRARTMTRGEGRCLVEEEELREPPRLEQRGAVPATELEPAGDPPPARVPPSDPARIVVKATAIPVDEPSPRVRNQLAERCHPVLEGHRPATLSRPWETPSVELHPQAQAVLDYIASFGYPPITEVSPDEARAIRRVHLRPSAIELDEIRAVDAAGVPSRLYRPSSDEGLGLLVYFHGGGWVVGDLETHDSTCRLLAAESGHAVLAVDYRLAPEHPFPAALDDAVAATGWAAANAEALGCAPGKLAVGGDSAGGNLAAAVSQQGAVPLRFQLLVYPVTDVRCNTESYEDFAAGPYLTRASMAWYIGHYLSGGDVAEEDPRVSPLLAADEALAKSPPTHVVTVEMDVLRDEGEAYAERLRAAGVPTTHRRYEGMFHGFFALPEVLDAGREAVAEASEALRRALT